MKETLIKGKMLTIFEWRLLRIILFIFLPKLIKIVMMKMFMMSIRELL